MCPGRGRSALALFVGCRSSEGGLGDKEETSVKAQEYVATLLRGKIAEPLSEEALKELATLYSQLSEGLNALDTLDLGQIEPAVSFVMSEAKQNDD